MNPRTLALPGLVLLAFASQAIPQSMFHRAEPLPAAAWPDEGFQLAEPAPEPPPRAPVVSLGDPEARSPRHSRPRRHHLAASRPAPAAPALDGDVLAALTVRGAVRAIAPVAQRCYERALRQDPDLRGEPVFRLHVGNRGRVTSVIIERDVEGAPHLSDCLADALGGIRLPASASHMDVEVPYLLRPADKDGGGAADRRAEADQAALASQS